MVALLTCLWYAYWIYIVGMITAKSLHEYCFRKGLIANANSWRSGTCSWYGVLLICLYLRLKKRPSFRS